MAENVTAKQAIASSVKFLKGTLDNQVSGLIVEEVIFDELTQTWSVTLSYEVAKNPELPFSESLRVYKSFQLNQEGLVLGMRIRQFDDR